MDHGRVWAADVATGIGQRVAFYRDRLGMSAQQLADRCAEVGLPSLSRVVITKLENGRREAVSTAELQVLAKALDVPPVLLLFPVLRASAVEVLPGQPVDPYAAIAWFLGSSSDPADPAAQPQLGADSPLILREEHIRLDELLSMDARTEGRGRLEPGYVGDIAAALRRLRATIRNLGMTPPGLHPATADLIGEPAAAVRGEAWPGNLGSRLSGVLRKPGAGVPFPIPMRANTPGQPESQSSEGGDDGPR